MFESLFDRNGLSLERLRSLVEVDEAGGIAKAAPGDPVQQSKISKNLSQLETFFGTELKRRKGKGIELTAAGKRLATMARRQILSLETFAQEARSETQEIRIGGGQSAIEWSLLPRLSEMEKCFRLQLVSMRSQEVIRRLDDFSLDVGLVRKTAIQSKTIAFRQVATIRYALFVERAVAARHDCDAWSLLASIPLATSMGGEYRRRFDELAETGKITPDIRFSCSSFRTALEFVKQSASVGGLLPDSASHALPPGEFTEIPLPFLQPYERELVLAWQKRILDIRPAVGHFIASFDKSGKRL